MKLLTIEEEEQVIQAHRSYLSNNESQFKERLKSWYNKAGTRYQAFLSLYCWMLIIIFPMQKIVQL